MTAQQRWLIGFLAAAGAALLVLAGWQQLRLREAEDAVARYLRLETRAANGAPAGEALAAHARPELRRLLLRGDFAGTLRRLAALEAEEAGAGTAPAGEAIAPEQLWPAGPAREQARRVLRSVTEAQRRGYDVRAAQEALVETASAARSGSREQALAAFARVEAALAAAPLRPGFRAPAPKGGPAPEGSAPPPDGPARLARSLAQARAALPMLIAAAPDAAQRELLRQVQAFLEELEAAQRARRDLRPVAPYLQRIWAAAQAQEPGAVDALLEQARAALKSAPLLPAGAPEGPGAPGRREAPMRREAPPVPDAPAPAGGDGPRAPLLAALDRIRSLPEAEYRREREQIAGLLAALLARRAQRPPGAGEGSGPGAPAGGVVGEADAVQLAFGPEGEIAAVRAAGRELAAGLPTGGFLLEAGGREIPLRGALRPAGTGLARRAQLEGWDVRLDYRSRDGELAITGAVRRAAPGAPAALLLRLPLRAAGWTWVSGGEERLVAITDRPAALGAPGAGPAVLLRGPGLGLAITAPPAAELSLDAAGGMLLARFPLPAEAGESRHTLRLGARKQGL